MQQIKCCKECERRIPGCHDFCAQYKAEKAKIEEEKEAIRKEKQIVDYYFTKRYKKHSVQYVNSTKKRHT